jgi:hypothetical protein
LDLAKTPAECASILNTMAYGYARGGHTDEAGKVLDLAKTPAECASILNTMAYGYARGGHTDEAGKVLDLAKTPAECASILNTMAYGYARGGHTDEAGKVLDLAKTPAERASILKNIVGGGKQRGDELAESIALKGLSLEAHDDSRSVLVRELKESKAAATYDIAKLIPRAKKINQIMTTEGQHYTQGFAWTQRELPVWILQFKRKDIIPEAVLLVASFLAPPMSGKEWNDFSNRFSFKINFNGCRDTFFKGLLAHNKLLSISERASPKNLPEQKEENNNQLQH